MHNGYGYGDQPKIEEYMDYGGSKAHKSHED